MIIIPFIHNTTHIAPMTLSVVQILTMGGDQLWSEEDESLRVEEDILHPNGIFLCYSPIRHGDMLLCQVDPTKTKMDDFYRWEDISLTDKDTFCWRTFYLPGDATHYSGWLPIPPSLTLGSYSAHTLVNMIVKEVSKP